MPRPNRHYAREAARTPQGTLVAQDPLARFASKCAFDPVTGCVMWAGTTTHGKGRNEPYGYFWFKDRMWLAHRWAALHIHGFDIDGVEADHCCPAGPSTLCVQHLRPLNSVTNRARKHDAPSRAAQSLTTKRHWLFVSLGIEPYRPPDRDETGAPFHSPPPWLVPFLPAVPTSPDCPF